jgi:hypothetical protein
MKTLKVVLPFILLCLLLLTCRDREPLNPLDPDNPTTRGQRYTIQAAATGIGEAKVHWRKVTEPEVKSYRIYRSLEGGVSSQVADATDTLFVDTQLQAARAYSYFYRLIWEDGRELHQSPTAGVVTFNAPTGLTITNVTRNRVEMQWNGLSWLDNYARCRIYRQSGGAFSLHDSTSANQYVDTRVDTGITYHYGLMAVGTDGSQSNYSAEAYATPGNSAPVIDSLGASQPFTGWGEQVTITCYAHDNDGDPILYSWQALDGGTITGSGRAVTFQVPQDSIFSHRVMVTVSDNHSIGGKDTISIEAGQIPIAGLVAYYPFHGNANDESGNGNNGIIHGATPTSDRFGSVTEGYSLDGRSSYILVGNNKSLNFGRGDFSICAWFRMNAYLDSIWANQILCKLEPNGGSYEIQVNYSKKVLMWTSEAGSPVVISSNDLINLGRWYFVAGIRKGGALSMYINGIKQIASTLSEKNVDNLSALYIGKDSYLSEYFNGSIDDIRIYSRALSEAEIQALYHEGGWAGN